MPIRPRRRNIGLLVGVMGSLLPAAGCNYWVYWDAQEIQTTLAGSVISATGSWLEGAWGQLLQTVAPFEAAFAEKEEDRGPAD
ncbi:MAG: hypothetical protein HJJLKODD_00690 [Phycisphaerae bacterium]|nr:hypothetical protein [Phycisphaerae bacterium]